MILLDLTIIMEEHLELDPNQIAGKYDLEPISFKNWDDKRFHPYLVGDFLLD